MVMVSSAEALMARAQGVNDRKERTTHSTRCRFCGGYHWSDECQKCTTMGSRKQRINGCCYICLRDGHNASECLKWESKCYFCKQINHYHRSRCPQKFDTTHRESAKLADEIPIENGLVNTERKSILPSGEMV